MDLSNICDGGASHMENIIRFIGKDYEIPKDLDYYIESLAFFNKMRNDLILTAVKKIKSSEVHCIDDKDMLPKFNEYIGKVIKMLCDKEIYNKTNEEYLNNKGYELFSEANKLACNEFVAYLSEEMDSMLAGMECAYERAASNITGTGVKVFSSSFLTLAASSAYEYSVLKMQANEADKQYGQEINIALKSAASTREKKELNYVKSTYIPNVESSISLFTFAIMDKYISDIIQAGKFNEKTLQYVDFKKSNSLLKNLSLSSNKQAILENAFISCPFNDAIYEKAAELGLCDIKTLETAKKYCPNNKVAQSIIISCTVKNKHCNYKDEYHQIVPFLPIITLQWEKSEAEAVKLLYNIPYEYYRDTFANYKNIINISDKSRMKKFVSSIIAKDYTDLCTKTIEQIKQNISSMINENINIDNYNFLSSLGYNLGDLENSSTSQSIIDYYTENIANAVINYIAECKTEYEKIITLKKEHEKILKEKKLTLTALEQELSEQGLFAISKKRDIKQKIEKAKFDRDNYYKQSNYDKQLASFQERYIG